MNNESNYFKSVAIYCRLSKDDGTSSDSSSIKSQKELIIKYVNDHKWNIFDIYIDDGYSGTNFERPGFIKMCQDIEKGRIDTVITKDLSRLGRNYIKTGQIIDEYFPSHNVRFIAISDNIDTNKEDDVSLDFAPFKNVINEWYARDTSKKIRSVLKMKRKNGIVIKAPFPLYGYKYSENNTIEIDEETSFIVRYIFNEYARNTPTSVIKKYLFDNKIYTPGYYAYKKYGYNKLFYEKFDEEKKYTWKTCIIDRLITNKEYTGLFISSKTTSINFKNHRRRKVDSSEYTFEGIRPRIVSNELFGLANKRKQLLYRPRKKDNNLAHFQGLLYCACCGRILNYKVLNNVKGKYHQEFYACNAKNCSINAYITSKAIKQILIEEMGILKKCIIENEEILNEFAKNYIIKNTINNSLVNNKIELLKAEIQKLEILIMNLFNEYNLHKIPNEIYEKYSKEYTLDYEKKSKEIDILLKQKETKSYENYVKKIKMFIESLKTDDYFNNKLLNILIEKIIVDKEFIYGENNRTHYKVNVKIIFAFNNNYLEKIYNRCK